MRWRYVLVAVVTGVPLGVWAHLPYQVPAWDGLVTLLAVAGVFGSAMALLAVMACRSRLRVLLPLLGLVGLSLAPTVVRFATLLPHGRWRPIAPPPVPVVSLFGPECVESTTKYVAYVRTADGRVLGLRARGGLPLEPAKWAEALADETPFDRCRRHPPQPDSFWLPRPWPPPGDAKTWHTEVFLGAEGAVRQTFVMLADGTFWFWLGGLGMAGPILLLGSIPIGLGLGFLPWLILRGSPLLTARIRQSRQRLGR